jgi:hypothetical protein
VSTDVWGKPAGHPLGREQVSSANREPQKSSQREKPTGLFDVRHRQDHRARGADAF